MKEARMKGRTVEEAIEGALKVLGAKREEVEIKVISEGKGGVLGVFGGEEAEVEVRLKGEMTEEARDILQNILDKMGFMTLVTAVGQEEDAVNIEVKGEDMGRIIGKEGVTLDALSYLVSVILSKQHARRIRVRVDAEGYRKKKERRLERMAEEAAAEVISSGKEVVFPPMSSAERRVIHLALAENAKVTSFSRGERGMRHVVVALKEGKGEPAGE